MLNQRHKFIVPLLFYFAVPLFIFSMLFMRLPGDSMLWREFQNAGHVPLFGFIALAILYMLRTYIPTVRDRLLYGYLMSAAVSLGIGVLSEYGQLLTDRDPSSYDVMRDLIGIVAGLGVYAGVDPRMKPLWSNLRRGLRSGTIILSCLLSPVSCLQQACFRWYAWLLPAYSVMKLFQWSSTSRPAGQSRFYSSSMRP